VTVLHSLLRLFSYAFNALFVFVASAMAVITSIGPPHTLNFHLLPWQGRALFWGLVALALMGAVVLMLAVRGKAQPVYRLWSLLVLALMVRYFFFSGYAFTPDTGEFTFAVGIVLCAVVSLLGAGIPVAARSR
jgi:hypothetical protein